MSMVEMPTGDGRSVASEYYARFAPYVHMRLAALGVRSADVPDVCHEVFVIVQSKCSTTLAIERPRAWLSEICRRVAARHRRSARYVREVLGLCEDEFVGPDEVEAPCSAERSSQLESLRRALERLDAKSIDLLALHHGGDLPLTELAKLTACDRKTLRKRLLLAQRRISAMMRDVEPSAASGAAAFGMMTGPEVVGSARGARNVGAAERVGSELEVLTVTSSYVVGVVGNVVIVVWSAAVTRPAIDWLRSLVVSLVDRSGEACVYVGVVEPTVGPPDLPTRRSIAEALSWLGPRLAGCAIWMRGGMAWLAQPILNAAQAFSSAQRPMRFFESVEPLADWVCKSHALAAEGRPSAQVLVAAIERLRRRVSLE